MSGTETGNRFDNRPRAVLLREQTRREANWFACSVCFSHFGITLLENPQACPCCGIEFAYCISKDAEIDRAKCAEKAGRGE